MCDSFKKVIEFYNIFFFLIKNMLCKTIAFCFVMIQSVTTVVTFIILYNHLNFSVFEAVRYMACVS